jgi:hypothetical protein
MGYNHTSVFINLLIFFFYGGGMPFMYFLGFLFFFTTFLVAKYTLFNWNRRGFEL